MSTKRYKIKHSAKGDHVVIDAGGYWCELNSEVVDAESFDAVVAERDDLRNRTQIDMCVHMAKKIDLLRAENTRLLAERDSAQKRFEVVSDTSVERGLALSELQDENARLTKELDDWKNLAVEMALPYEGILMDEPSRKWIAPTVWGAIETAVTAMRERLAQDAGNQPNQTIKHAQSEA